MKKYKCHKEVEAAVIHKVDVGQSLVFIDDGDVAVTVPEEFFARGIPDKGAYLVRYFPHNYLSWSPKSVFEDGYTLTESL